MHLAISGFFFGIFLGIGIVVLRGLIWLATLIYYFFYNLKNSNGEKL